MANYKAITNVPGWVEGLTSSGNLPNTAAAYAYVPLVYRAVRLRADALSAVPIKITSAKGQGEKEWPYPDPLETLLWRACVSLDMQGAGYWEIVKNKARVKKSVKYRNPFDITVSYNDGAYLFTQGSTGAKWTNKPDTGEYEMVYFAEYDPAQDVLPGIGAVEVALANAKLLHYMSRFASAFFEGGAMPVTLLGIDTTDSNEVARVESWFKRSAARVGKAFGVLGIKAGSIVPQQLTPKLSDLVMPELHAQAQHDVALAFGIPQTMLENSANFATAKEHRIGFYEEIIKPRGKLLANIVNTQLLESDGLKLEFDFEAMSIFQEDETARASRLQVLVATGIDLRLAAEIAGYSPEVVARMKAPEPEPEPAPVIVTTPMEQQPTDAQQTVAELRAWRRKAIRKMKAGKAPGGFESEFIPAALAGAIEGQLEVVKTAADLDKVFTDAIEGINGRA